MKTLRSGVPSAKMRKRADIGLKTLICTNACTLMKTLKSGSLSAKMTKRADIRHSSRAENAVFHKLVHFAENNLRVVRPVRK